MTDTSYSTSAGTACPTFAFQGVDFDTPDTFDTITKMKIARMYWEFASSLPLYMGKTCHCGDTPIGQGTHRAVKCECTGHVGDMFVLSERLLDVPVFICPCDPEQEMLLLYV